ncbi:WXG100 family type VII secretion target [Prauserella endophytica]|uniref:WXG100 family type VII secretion target n=1 Tax=Prauserella endophytica TaxID=1592324 RepID=A0ABY2SBD4_9PSEU|nr:hypothetical protein [Prauserella endophytica]TKG73192.1 hypothetical protein FCN18_00950 [Prauserella endophytica]
MPSDTEIKSNAASIRTVAQWLSTRAGEAHGTGSQVYGARGDSESTWTGPASDGFRSTMTRFGQQIDGLVGDLNGTTAALNSHADDVDTAKSRMSQALEIARAGGLTVNGHIIEEPGPAPAAPAPLPTDKEPTPRQQQIHDQATQAQSAHAQQVKAYVEAERVATPARQSFIDSQNTFVKFAKGYAEKAPINIADISTGLAGAVAQRTSNFRAAARAMDPAIERAAAYAKSGRTNPFAQVRADALEIERRLAKQAELNKAVATRTARMVDRLPSNVKSILTTNLDFKQAQKPIANHILRGATKVGSKLPIVGGVITGLGIGLDIAGGKDAPTAVSSGVGGFVAGSLATAGIAAAGGPVGWAVAGGAVVSAGVGFVIEEWGDDIADMAGDAVDWAGDRLSDAGNMIGKAGKAVGDFFGDLF